MTNEMKLMDKSEVGENVAQTRELPLFTPPVDIWETDHDLNVVADMPGVTTEKLSVNIEGDSLTIHGEVHLTEEERQLRHREYEAGGFLRRFTVPGVIDKDMISADLKDGVLTLKLPKLEKAKPKQIEVKTE